MGFGSFLCTCPFGIFLFQVIQADYWLDRQVMKMLYYILSSILLAKGKSDAWI